jgi:hypothetical protein
MRRRHATDRDVQDTRSLANAILDLCTRHCAAGSDMDVYDQVLAALGYAAAAVIYIGDEPTERIFEATLKSSLASLRKREPHD